MKKRSICSCGIRSNVITSGDLGELCDEDKALNDEALNDPDCGGRIFSAYVNSDNENWRIWIITESDRSATTVLFPDEY